MGNNQSSQIYSQESLGTSPVIRYEVQTDMRYRGTFKHYVYVSKKYGVEIDPFNAHDPVHAYDAGRWEGMSNPKTTVYVKTMVLELCKEFLKAKELVTNEIQKTFDVG